jgi:pyruvate/2-oxoglutarate dehydrogenase complex dihydrolipoamide acyltransferase (E2) component
MSYSRGFIACVAASAIACVIAIAPTRAEAAKLSKADKIALKEATVACKAEAKGKHIRWPKSRSYVNNCLKEALKDHPNINVIQMDLEHKEMDRLPVQRVKDPI